MSYIFLPTLSLADVRYIPGVSAASFEVEGYFHVSVYDSLAVATGWYLAI
jgi:hypothetical protein